MFVSRTRDTRKFYENNRLHAIHETENSLLFRCRIYRLHYFLLCLSRNITWLIVKLQYFIIRDIWYITYTTVYRQTCVLYPKERYHLVCVSHKCHTLCAVFMSIVIAYTEIEFVLEAPTTLTTYQPINNAE